MKRYLLHAIFAIMLLVPNSALAVTAVSNPFAGTYTGTVTVNSDPSVSYDLILGEDAGLVDLGYTSGYMYAPSTYGAHPLGSKHLVVISDALTVTWDSSLPDTLSFAVTSLSDYFNGTAVFSNLVGGVYQSFIFQGTGSINMEDISIYASFSRTPIPGAVWLLGSGLAGLIGFRRRMNRA